MLCPLCMETIEYKISCPHCGYYCCQKCCKKYLFQSAKSHCMRCFTPWSKLFVSSCGVNIKRKKDIETIYDLVTVVERKGELCNNMVKIDGIWYGLRDFGVETPSDTNMCFYLCIEEGNWRYAEHLKKVMSNYVRKIDDSNTLYEGYGEMADINVILTYVIDWQIPLCIFDYDAGKCLHYYPRKSLKLKESVFLFRSGLHYQRLYQFKGSNIDN